MESDDDFQVLSPKEEPSPAARDRKLKRLKKAIRDSSDPPLNPLDEGPSSPLVDFSKSEALELDGSNGQDSQEMNDRSTSRVLSEGADGEDKLDSGSFDGLGGEEDGSGAKRALDFDSMAEESDIKGEDPSNETREGDLRMEEPEKKRVVLLKLRERMETRRRERALNLPQPRERLRRKEGIILSNSVLSPKESCEKLEMSFKPVPVVQKPISSILEKIRKRKLEVSKKYVAMKRVSLMNEDDDDAFAREVVVDCNPGDSIDERGDDGVANVASEEAIELPAYINSNLAVSPMDESNYIKDDSSHERSKNVEDGAQNSKQAFRIPIGDTQELFSDSLISDSKDELLSETPNSPLGEVLAPSILAMNLKLDSAAPEDDSSDEEEDNEKENVDPHPRGITDVPSSPDGDPVKAFVDDEAEEEDDSDDDLLRFQENEEDEEIEDYEELNDMIATAYEEKPFDNEKRTELHQTWLEQQDSAGMETLLQKLKCGSKLKETTLLEEEGDNASEDFGDEAEEDLQPTNVAKMNLRKVKQMIPQMFTDKDDVYLSSDDEETEVKLSKRRLFERADQATLLSPAEDENSREVFGLIKKLNIVPDTKKAKAPSRSDMSHIGGKKNISSKSSFLSRGSTHSLPQSLKNASSAVRSFIFSRDVNNSRTATISEDASDMIQRETRPTRPPSAKFSSSQIKTSTQNTKSVAEMKSGTSLFEILRRSSVRSEHHTQEDRVVQTESVFAAFKLAKKPLKAERKA
ncbi:hypothetical protein CJ030_MR3G015821 [Morella rubra]|uniref:DNA replication checkpoint mediator MRC1 domain-containing protein n=1 Tax=Morella rubra TaxID=262757 RepID=A0A6A1WA42_9ROSI|nr:hypothetical protein CJ030_MR3G015821 [Morella rubra]